jgi:D-alanyl-lipoteichoic acid acyltransferase DltB (MBOAT superfamily)
MKELYVKHKFAYQNICFGCQRIVWGLFKKLVISDRVGIIVSGIWNDSVKYTGFWPWVAAFLYPLQIYTDFSGCMDIVLGAAELFDIHLAENFNNPFFSRGLQEFWQRWHITLGTWARDYVFYPILKSRFLVSLGRTCKKKFGKKIGKFIPWCIGMAALWFVMGFWHGSIQHIFGVSLWYWIILSVSELLAPAFSKIKKYLDVKEDSFGWHLFQSIRTYILFAIGSVFFSASGLREAIEHFKSMFSLPQNLNPWTFYDGTIVSLGITWRDINIIILGVALLIVVGNLREKYGYARTWMKEQSFGLRWFVWLFLFFMVLIYGLYGPGYDAASFIYQGF